MGSNFCFVVRLYRKTASHFSGRALGFVAHPWGLVLFLFGFSRDGVNAAEPSMQVDIGASLRAERPVLPGLRVDAANDAEGRTFGLGLRVFWLTCHLKWNRFPRG